MEPPPEKVKPRICQAGSAEAFVGSAATGREQLQPMLLPSAKQTEFLPKGRNAQNKDSQTTKMEKPLVGAFPRSPLRAIHLQRTGLLPIWPQSPGTQSNIGRKLRKEKTRQAARRPAVGTRKPNSQRKTDHGPHTLKRKGETGGAQSSQRQHALFYGLLYFTPPSDFSPTYPPRFPSDQRTRAGAFFPGTETIASQPRFKSELP